VDVRIETVSSSFLNSLRMLVTSPISYDWKNSKLDACMFERFSVETFNTFTFT